jgi:hypothetical protein
LHIVESVLSNCAALCAALQDLRMSNIAQERREKLHLLKIRSIVNSIAFWVDVETLRSLLLPFLWVTIALESNYLRFS